MPATFKSAPRGWVIGTDQRGVASTIWDSIGRLIAVLPWAGGNYQDNRIGSPSTDDGRNANAKMIHAAPDVAESLVEITDWMRANTGPHDGTNDMLCRAMAALEKAGAEIK